MAFYGKVKFDSDTIKAALEKISEEYEAATAQYESAQTLADEYAEKLSTLDTEINDLIALIGSSDDPSGSSTLQGAINALKESIATAKDEIQEFIDTKYSTEASSTNAGLMSIENYNALVNIKTSFGDNLTAPNILQPIAFSGLVSDITDIGDNYEAKGVAEAKDNTLKTNTLGGLTFKAMTSSQYSSITPETNCVYFITD